jgi:hypothetical protein
VNTDALKSVHERRMNIDPLSMWDDQCVEGLRQDCQVPMLTVFDLVSSTNDIALAQAERGAPDGSVVMLPWSPIGSGNTVELFPREVDYPVELEGTLRRHSWRH